MTAKNLALFVAAALLGAAVVALGFMILDSDDAEPAPQIGEITAERTLPMPDESQDENGRAPDFELPTLDGEIFSLASHAGEVVVVNFWATWCAPCRIEIPDLIEMQSELGDLGIQFVGVSLDFAGRDVVETYAEETAFNYPIVMDDGEVAEKFGGVYALPTTIIIDREGVIRRRIPGLVTKGLLMPILEELARS